MQNYKNPKLVLQTNRISPVSSCARHKKNDCKWEKIKNNDRYDKHYEKTIFASPPVATELSSKLKARVDRRIVGLWPLVKWNIKLI